MKFKSTETNIIDEIRYNSNIKKTPTETENSTLEDNKKATAVLALYNAINVLFPYEIDRDEKDILMDIFYDFRKEINNVDKNDLEINNLISFGTNKYFIVTSFNVNGSKYLYMINGYFDKHDVALVKLDEKGSYNYIENDNEFNLVIKYLMLLYEQDILNIINSTF